MAPPVVTAAVALLVVGTFVFSVITWDHVTRAETSSSTRAKYPNKHLHERYRMPGHDTRENRSRPRAHELGFGNATLNTTALSDFSWGNTSSNQSFLTEVMSQSIPQYCGSCWAHAAVSALADRIKIARNADSPDVVPSVQAMLNYGAQVAGSCRGGTATGAYQWMLEMSKKNDNSGIPYETCQPYQACSSDSTYGSCDKRKDEWKNVPENLCKSCDPGSKCATTTGYPHATIAGYGLVNGTTNMRNEIIARGPIACAVDATPLANYMQGQILVSEEIIMDTADKTLYVPTSEKIAESGTLNHEISVFGWGHDPTVGESGTDYWHVRNSWGTQWGDLGFARVAVGSIGIEIDCAYPEVKSHTEITVVGQPANQALTLEGDGTVYF